VSFTTCFFIGTFFFDAATFFAVDVLMVFYIFALDFDTFLALTGFLVIYFFAG